MSEENVYVGLDLSFTSSGVAVKQGNKITVGTIKTDPKNFSNDIERIVHIRNKVFEKIPENVSIICIEDIFAGLHPGSGMRLAMLAAIVRLAMYEKGIKFFTCAPTSLKKFITGKGVGQKDMIVKEVYKKYGLDVEGNDDADAVVLCHIAENLHQALDGRLDIDIPKYQTEVIKNLMSNVKERGYNILS